MCPTANTLCSTANTMCSTADTMCSTANAMCIFHIQPTTANFAVICMMFLNEYPFNKVILMVNKGSIANKDNSLTI